MIRQLIRAQEDQYPLPIESTIERSTHSKATSRTNTPPRIANAIRNLRVQARLRREIDSMVFSLRSPSGKDHTFYILTVMLMMMYVRGYRLRHHTLTVRISVSMYMCTLMILQMSTTEADFWILSRILDGFLALPLLFVIVTDRLGPPVEILPQLYEEFLAIEATRKRMGHGAISKILQKTTAPKDDVCAVCRDDFRNPVKLPCQHIYCEECIRLSLSDCNSCPYCKREYS